jgi:DNA-binding winged helix-turn-helix (wHTH) protein
MHRQHPVLALAETTRRAYSFAVNAHRVWLQNRFLLVACFVFVCTGLALGLFLNAYASLARTSFRERTLSYAQAFAATAGSWVARGQTDVVATLADFLVTGSVLGVEITDPDGAPTVLSGSEVPAATQEDMQDWPRQGSNGGAPLLVDVSMPGGTGRVRMLVDTGSAESAVRHAILVGVTGAALFDGAILALVGWVLRGRRKTTGPEQPPEALAEYKQIVVGDLVIVPARCEASYAGRPLRLTPKQFALLSVLASEPGRVFAEAEILAAAWPDSPYADARDIKQYVYLLRRRMAGIRPDGRDVIVTVPGFGYRLDDRR